MRRPRSSNARRSFVSTDDDASVLAPRKHGSAIPSFGYSENLMRLGFKRAITLAGIMGCGGPAFTTIAETDGGGTEEPDDGTNPTLDAANHGPDGTILGDDAGSPVMSKDGGKGPKDSGAASGPEASTPEASVDEDAGHGEDGCVLVVHTNGEGQTWKDCNPLATYNDPQGTAACDAYAATINLSASNWNCIAGGGANACGTSAVCYAQLGGNGCDSYCWSFAGANAGKVLACVTCDVAGSWE
jgi:hypothetical protein